MTIISQNRVPDALPDFRNLGTQVRILLAINLAILMAALTCSDALRDLANTFTAFSTVAQPTMLAAMLCLAAINEPLHRQSYSNGVLIVLGSTALICAIGAWVFGDPTIKVSERIIRALLYGATSSGVLLNYFYLRNRALSPALAEARLQALQARIRPHFLFNSLNAVLSMIRSKPRVAERALEDLADLFRVVMADNNQLSSLKRELELASNYLAIEQLRLGERLQLEWHIEKAPLQAKIPPLVIQPLLENAVYHGIEPCETPGIISINAYRSRNEVHLDIRNPFSPDDGKHHAGNKMAMGNIRERLALFFDAEASLTTTVGSNYYQVHIVLPYRE
ncbi:two-component system sensor histidine kinase AlgZ [Chitinivorax tropicus]|uniref:Two-component system sensor histidine kinase AlgZ n=1 Tax=Chitinivorax tropicus TaxID=714531 RepID=A0A840MM01_9PROT|nr:histidine kinase [Chitinivorax tropicus]MBB5017732.1 two-component system sensor histidine kinase AlgZ [Chitinivorax tropicus]